jgi:hypothetical protein
LRWRVQEIRKPAFVEITPRDESEAARRLAKELFQECGWKDISVKFSGRVPRLKQDAPDGDEKAISLSHHGGFVAAAVAWSPGSSWGHAETAGSSMARGL